MNCPFCNTPNVQGAETCKNCDLKLAYAKSSEATVSYADPVMYDRTDYDTESSSSDTMLLVYLCITFGVALIQFGLRMIFNGGVTQNFQVLLWLFGSISFILIPLSIKDRSKKTIGLVLGILLILYWSYNNIRFLFM